jgi:endonuclease/exonuclease/phosphatase family metal-dependent hydrolase
VLGRTVPPGAVFGRPGPSGAGLFSGWPLADVGLIPGSAERLPMPRARLRVPAGPEVEVVGTHPSAPTGSQQAAGWHRGLRSLPRPERRGPVRVLLGDFNATLDHAALRDLLDGGYVDAAAAVGKGLTPTWPRGRLLAPTVAIDHVLVDSRVRVREVGIHELPGSDHRAVSAELVLPRARTTGGRQVGAG